MFEFFTRSNQAFKGPYQSHLCFCLHARVLAIIFYSEHVETKDITVELLNIIEHTFRSTPYSKTISLHHAKSIILMASNMAEADVGP